MITKEKQFVKDLKAFLEKHKVLAMTECRFFIPDENIACYVCKANFESCDSDKMEVSLTREYYQDFI
jgi:hypothetical protein